MVRCKPPRRSAFSFVEVLVTIFIIAMLSGLTFVAMSSATIFVDKLEKDVAIAAKTGYKLKSVDTSRRVGSRWVVIFQDTVADPKVEVQRICAAEPVEITHIYTRLLKGVAVKTTDVAVGLLKQDPAVKYVHLEQIYRYCVQTTPTGVRRLNVPLVDVGGRTGGGPGAVQLNPQIRNLAPVKTSINSGAAVICIMDSGCDQTHPDLNIVVNKAFDSSNTNDDVGHGTHVAGIAGARHNNIGVVGAAPGARIWAYKVADDNGGVSDPGILAAIDELGFHADEVMSCNMSFGGGFSQSLNDAVDRLVDTGIVVCVAAGNETADAKDVSPASAPKAICVAALSDTDGKPGGKGKASTSTGDADDTFASYSNYGKTVHVITPGTEILSTVPGGGYEYKDGTSMASPYAAGLCALIVLKNQPSTTSGGLPPPRIGNLNPITGSPIVGFPVSSGQRLTPAQVLQQLIASSNESIPGLASNSDDKTLYPLPNASRFP